MWHDCFVIDYFQQLLVANKNIFKGTSLSKIVEISNRFHLKPPKHNILGSNVKELYIKGNYSEIDEHLKQDLRMIRWLDLYGAKRLIERSIKTEKALFYE